MRKSSAHRLSGGDSSSSLSTDFLWIMGHCCGGIEVPGSVSDPVMCGEANLDLPVFETYLTTHPVPSKAYEY